jgi:hypothetical protein
MRMEFSLVVLSGDEDARRGHRDRKTDAILSH